MQISDLRFGINSKGNVRVSISIPRTLGWAEYDLNGNLVDTCKEDWMSHFPHDLDNEIANVIKSFRPSAFGSQDVYLRFNEIPENRKSINWSTGKTEIGLSVYPLEYDIVNGYYKICGDVLQGAVIQYIFKRANIYFVTGNVSGTGSDNEPLLSNVKILSQAQYDGEGYTVKW